MLFACDVSETAGDDSRRGGYYAYNLIDVAETWAENNTTDLSKRYATFRVPHAHDRASEAVRRLSSNRQNPQIEKPRTDVYAGSTGRISIVPVVLIAAMGAIIGDNIGYFIGRSARLTPGPVEEQSILR